MFYFDTAISWHNYIILNNYIKYLYSRPFGFYIASYVLYCYVHTCGTIRISEVVVPAGERASAEECLKTSLSHTLRDKNGPVYYYDFNAADCRCKSRSCNALQPIGTTDRHGDWFFGIHADRRGARYHRRHGETAVILVRETVREKEQWHTHIHIQDICIYPYIRRRGVQSFQFPVSRNRRPQPVQSYRCTTGCSWPDSFESASRRRS